MECSGICCHGFVKSANCISEKSLNEGKICMEYFLLHFCLVLKLRAKSLSMAWISQVERSEQWFFLFILSYLFMRISYAIIFPLFSEDWHTRRSSSSQKSLTNNCSSCRPLLLQLQAEFSWLTPHAATKCIMGNFQNVTWIKVSKEKVTKRLFVCVWV